MQIIKILWQILLVSTVSLMTIMSMTQGPKLPSGWTCPNSSPSTKPFQTLWKCQLLQEEDEMGRECDVVHFHSKHSKSIKNSHKSHSTTQPTLIEKTKVRNHIDKLVPIHLVSTFPPFHLHLLVHPMQFSIYSLHDVTDTLNNPTSLFRTISKVCHFFSISSPNFINRINQYR